MSKRQPLQGYASDVSAPMHSAEAEEMSSCTNSGRGKTLGARKTAPLQDPLSARAITEEAIPSSRSPWARTNTCIRTRAFRRPGPLMRSLAHGNEVQTRSMLWSRAHHVLLWFFIRTRHPSCSGQKHASISKHTSYGILRWLQCTLSCTYLCRGRSLSMCGSNS